MNHAYLYEIDKLSGFLVLAYNLSTQGPETGASL